MGIWCQLSQSLRSADCLPTRTRIIDEFQFVAHGKSAEPVVVKRNAVIVHELCMSSAVRAFNNSLTFRGNAEGNHRPVCRFVHGFSLSSPALAYGFGVQSELQ